ncbi:MAG: HTH-type transcriptional regulator/antitoxin HipB [Paracrocinitomix sp.]|jgi:HTH-type transcriptional regulator/antitoxin HipB
MQFQVRDTQELATAIRHLRRSKQITQMDLAQRAGVSRKWISDVESNKSGLRFTTILVLLDALDVDLTLQPRDKPSLDLDDLLGLSSPSD